MSTRKPSKSSSEDTTETTYAERAKVSLEKVVKWFEDWEQNTKDERAEAEQARRYKDGDQLSDSVKQVLKERSQPELVFNHIAPKVEYILGTEIETRVDPNALPRSPVEDDEAQCVTDALRATCDVGRFDSIKSDVADNVFVEGTGGAVVEVEDRSRDGQPRIEIVYRHVPWDRGWRDPHSRRHDYLDAKYLGLFTWMDLEDAIDEYERRGAKQGVVANAQSILEATINDWNSNAGPTGGDSTDDKPKYPRGWADKDRERVRVFETYYRIGREWYVCHWVRSGFIIAPRPTGYLDEDGHNECPLIMTSGNVGGQKCDRYGIVRAFISPQDEINHRRSKAVHAINVPDKVIGEEGAVEDPIEFMRQLATPGKMALVKPGRMVDGTIKIESHADLSAGNLQMMQEAKSEIDGMGPSAQVMAMGDMNNGDSARALLVKQKAAGRQLAKVFDHLSDWERRMHVATWHRIRQFKTFEWWGRVRDDRNKVGYRFVGFNRRTTKGRHVEELLRAGVPLPSALAAVRVQNPQALQQAAAPVMMQLEQAKAMGQQVPQEAAQQAMVRAILAAPEMQQPWTANDVSRLDVDIILDRIPDTAVIEQEQFGMLTQIAPALAQQRPDLGPVLAKAIVKASQLRNKQEILDEMDKGQDPAAAQMQQQMQALQQSMQQLQAMLLKANVEKTQAQTQEQLAKAELERAQAQVVGPTAAADAQQSMGQAMVHAANAGEKTAAPMSMNSGRMP